MASGAAGAPEYQEREVRREVTPPPAAGAVQTSAAAVTPARNAVQWGPVWAGLIGTFAIFMLLETLAAGIGLVTTNDSGTGAWVTGIVALIAFFVGGWIAQVTSVVRGSQAGILNGLMVWALGTVLFFLLSLFGLSALFGAIGSVVSQFFAVSRTIGNVTTVVVATNASAAGWGAFFTLLLTAILAAIGGWVGDRMGPIGWTRSPEPPRNP